MADGFPYEQIIGSCLAEGIGDHGLSRGGFEAALAETVGALQGLRARHADSGLPLLRLPETRDDVPGIEARAEYHRDRAEDVVVLGTGGSSLGGQALYALTDSGFGPSGHAPRMHFLDNVDPHTFDHLFRAVDLGKTDFIVISKSGSTAETMTQFLICLAAVAETVGRARAGDHFTVITEPRDNVLRRIAEDWGMLVLDHDPDIGGRYAALSLVGLLPAAIAGLDVAQVREGAHQVLHQTLSARRPEASDPAVGAAIAIGLWREKRIGTSVLMPYSDRLAWFGMWYRQLWAESLGKDGKGTLPVRAMGTVDQHSQLQLYLAGPRDKMFTVVLTACAGRGRMVPPELAADPTLAYLAGRQMGDLLDAEGRATAETLVRNGRPTRLLHLDRVDESVMGGLMMHYFLETIIAAHLLKVDPFDQPAVEEGKVLTRDHLGAMPRRV
ncbi:MAG: glucose-6-phosphate isomerase [Alphaproteobacteria bacterium]